MKTRFSLEFILIFAFLSWAALGAEQILQIGNGAEPKDLDPQVVTGNPEGHILRNLFEGLVVKDPRTAEPREGVSEMWKFSKDGTQITFLLRQNATWSDGSPLTAEDFVYSWTRLLSPSTAAEGAFQAYAIKNGEEFNKGKITDAKQLGLRAIDARTFQVTLKYPVPYFIRLISHYNFYPVPRKAIEKHGSAWTRAGNLVSNGPFLLEKWEVNKVISLKKNPKYWDVGQVKLESVNFHATKSDVEEKLFRTGKLHSISEIPVDRVPYWAAEGKDVFHKSAYLGNYFYWFNVNHPPLDNPLVRKALNLAIDRGRITKYVTKADQAPATAFVPPGCGGYIPKPILPTDGSRIAEAKTLLAKAGYPGGKGFPKIELLYNTNENLKKIAEATQAMWKENLGIEVQLLNQEWKVYLENMNQRNFQMARAGWTADYNDPNTFLNLFLSDADENHAGWKSEKYDTLMKKADREMNQRRRLDLLKKAEAILLDELPVLPVYYYTRLTLRSPKVKGWYDNVEDAHPLKEVYLVD
jgi:oligopeptide transport system substrate-binding protein